MSRRAELFVQAAALVVLVSLAGFKAEGRTAITKQESLDQWRNLTLASAPAPRVFVKGDQVQFFFPGSNGLTGFKTRWTRVRIPASGYKVKSALLHWAPELKQTPEKKHGWREATVIAGTEWHRLATNLFSALAPASAGHGVYYQAFLADGLVYRDRQGAPRFVPVNDAPTNVVIERRFSIEETLEAFARVLVDHVTQDHPRDSLFLIMAPNPHRFVQPLLLDRQQHRCVLLSPAPLYDFAERGGTMAATAEGFIALLPESHGLALLKNPFSSIARLADLGLETVVRFVRFPLPRPGYDPPHVAFGKTMDLVAWEEWLDRHTGTRLERGSLELWIDGFRFFPHFQQALAEATNSIRLNIYMFDRDDVAISIADELKRRAADVDVRVLLDKMGSIAAGMVPPTTPLPVDFVAPASIISYLREDSRVHVRPFLNPWFSSNHSKVLLVDGTRAWLGGMNFGHEYRYEWHDLMVELQGPIVRSLETEFRRQWAHAGPLGDFAYAAALVRGSPHAPLARGAGCPTCCIAGCQPASRPNQNLRSQDAPGPDAPVGTVSTASANSTRPERRHTRVLASPKTVSDAPALPPSTLDPQPSTNPGRSSPSTLNPQPSTNYIPIRRLPTRTFWKPFASAVLGVLPRAQGYIYVENPYLFDKRVILALVHARNRGVDVRVILPRVNDFKAGGRGNLVVANYLLEHGVRVYFYPGMTHVKALLVDGWACLGSGNLNHLSLRLNQEQNVATSDPGVAAKVKTDLFAEDFARSYELKEPISVDWVDFLADLALEGF